MAKTNNRRKYPEANHQPNHKAADRKMRAEIRQEIYNELTLEQKIAALPPEPHAKKQRARLMKMLEKQNAKAQAEAELASRKQAAEIEQKKGNQK